MCHQVLLLATVLLVSNPPYLTPEKPFQQEEVAVPKLEPGTRFNSTEEQLKQDPNNTSLQEAKTQLEKKLSANPLYQQYMKLGLQSAQLRQQENQKRDDTQINSVLSNGVVLSSKLHEASKHQQEADAIKEGCLVPLRGLFNRPNTPPLQRKASAFGNGAAQSVKDTGESFVGAVKFLDRLYDKIAASLATGEDKVGFKEGIVKAKDFYQKLVDEVKQDWENREEYQERMQAAKAIKQQIQAYELAFNAEECHLKHAKNAGYVSTEALQWVFGGEVIKVVGKGLQVTTKGLGELGVKVLESMDVGKGIKGATTSLPVILSQRTKQLLQGEWIKTTEKMSERAAKYQELITKRKLGEVYKLNGVKFDGVAKEGVLLDAKSGYKNFINKEGQWHGWFTGHEDLVKQAERQIAAANGAPIEWHFEHKEVRDLVEELFNNRGIKEIELIHSPLQ